MQKPIPVTQPAAYDYHACRDWINRVYRITIEDYANCFGPDGDSERPFLSFWHWIMERCDIHNGCYFGLDLADEAEDSETPDWVKQILLRFLVEFAPNDTEGYTHWFWVSW
jgi:hypothetical protein